MAIETVPNSAALEWLRRYGRMPSRFARYCEVYYPYIESIDAGSGASLPSQDQRLVKWREVADLLGHERIQAEEGLRFRPGLRMTYLLLPTSAFVGPIAGELPVVVYDHLIAALVPHTDEQDCYFVTAQLSVRQAAGLVQRVA